MIHDINEYYTRTWYFVPVSLDIKSDNIHHWCNNHDSTFGYQICYKYKILDNGEIVEYVSGVKFQSESDAAMFKLTYKID